MERGAVAAGAVLTALVLDVTLWFRRGEFERGSEWLVTGAQRALALGLTAVVVVAVLLVGRFPAVRHGAVGAVGIVAVVVLVGTYVGGRMSVDGRYDDTTRSSSTQAWGWAQQLPPTRVGIIGSLFQGPYVGADLATYVRYVGVTRDDGGLRDVHSCPELRRALADGNYEYLVTALNFGGSNAEQVGRVRNWVSSVPGTEVVFRSPTDVVYRLGRPLDPDACP
jgi:hypothetical protein